MRLLFLWVNSVMLYFVSHKLAGEMIYRQPIDLPLDEIMREFKPLTVMDEHAVLIVWNYKMVKKKNPAV